MYQNCGCPGFCNGNDMSMATWIPMASPPAGGRNPDASKEGHAKTPSARTLRGLDWLNFFLADVQTGIGPFLAIYLAGYGWNEQRVGIALTVGESPES
jgi:hypothetical protein